MEIKRTMPLTEQDILSLKAGDKVLLSGTIYTARDAAHKRMYETLLAGSPLPFDLKGQAVYYVGPCPARDGQIIGSAGPTTSARMDKYTPLLLDNGLKVIIGKGQRSPQVVDSLIKNKALYFAAVGGAGALIAKCITESQLIAYDDLLSEAVRKLTVKDFPLILSIDCHGGNLYESEQAKYRRD